MPIGCNCAHLRSLGSEKICAHNSSGFRCRILMTRKPDRVLTPLISGDSGSRFVLCVIRDIMTESRVEVTVLVR
jgi:hypothetical protein